MLNKFKSNPEYKERILKVVAVLIVISVALLSFDVFTKDHDQRKQIIDEEKTIESTLCSILTDIKGVGAVNVMLQYDEDNQITGVIVTAQGAEDPVSFLHLGITALLHRCKADPIVTLLSQPEQRPAELSGRMPVYGKNIYINPVIYGFFPDICFNKGCSGIP